jgi:hypothetical protein
MRVQQFLYLRDIGVGVTSSTLFDIMGTEVPAFASLSRDNQWNWFRAFTARHKLSIRRPNHITGGSGQDEVRRATEFANLVKDKMLELNLILVLIIDNASKAH